MPSGGELVGEIIDHIWFVKGEHGPNIYTVGVPLPYPVILIESDVDPGVILRVANNLVIKLNATLEDYQCALEIDGQSVVQSVSLRAGNVVGEERVYRDG